MNDDRNPDPLQDLPEDLARLDEELKGIHLSERPSFGPELKAELERAWLEGMPQEETSERGGLLSPRRVAAAASLVLLFGTLSVPPARAALAELSRNALVSVGVLDEPAPSERDPVPASVLTAPPLETPVLDPVTLPPSRAEPRPRAEEDAVVEVEPDASADRADPAFTGISATFPELVDRRSEQLAIRRHYPEELLAQGIGGTVRMLVWVDADGRVDHVDVRGSGYPELDRAARRAVRELDFVPATRGGSPVGTWVEFDMVFEPRLAEDDAASASAVADVEGTAIPDMDLATWSAGPRVTPEVSVEAQELLGRALEDRDDGAELGSLESLLRGVPPAGASPLVWRAEAMSTLREAIAAHPENPAPYLALGRILKKQGLTAEARTTFDRGLERTEAVAASTSPGLVAELQYERGMLLKAGWLASADLGRLEVRAEDTPRCARTAQPEDPTAPEALIALNFLCPDELERIMESSFHPVDAGMDRAGMRTAFEAAVASDAGHVGANREILLDLARDERWVDVLGQARRFAIASWGHPHAFLFAGIALQRLGRTEEALDEFRSAFRGLPPVERDAMTSIRPLLSDEEAVALDDLAPEERRGEVRAFWNALDPILGTDVNEREVEHMARAAWAILRFGGIDTEAGDLWVRYGAPQGVRTVGAGSDLLVEFWDYGGAPYATFRRPAMSTHLELTAEARAYLDDLRHVFPHRYGNRARRVTGLPAAVARFELPGGGTEVEIHSAVPDAFRVGDPGSLEVSVFTVGPDGAILTSRSVRPAGHAIAVSVEAAPEAAAVVLEVLDRERGEAASIRTSVPREDAEAGGARVSDLLFVEGRDAPGAEVTRRDRWVEPLPPGEIAAERVGVMFEIYDLPDVSYRTRVEAVPVDGGETLSVPHRPAGEMHFVSSWSRPAPSGSEVRTEYLTLDLTGVPSGDYTLRVSVEFPDGTSPAVATGTLYRARGGTGR